MKGKLTILNGKWRGRTFYVDRRRSQTTLGRESRNDIVLEGKGISRTHCCIQNWGQGWMIADLNSSNGTVVNGDNITECRLHPGDRIKIGTVVLRFELPGAGASAAALAASDRIDDSSAIAISLAKAGIAPPRTASGRGVPPSEGELRVDADGEEVIEEETEESGDALLERCPVCKVGEVYSKYYRAVYRVLPGAEALKHRCFCRNCRTVLKETKFGYVCLIADKSYDPPVRHWHSMLLTASQLRALASGSAGFWPGAKLVVLEGKLRGKYCVLHPNRETALGRDGENDLCIGATGASGKHCRFLSSGDRWSVVDCNSTNGTFVNEKRVEQQELRTGDEIRIGKARFKFEVVLNPLEEGKFVIDGLGEEAGPPLPFAVDGADVDPEGELVPSAGVRPPDVPPGAGLAVLEGRCPGLCYPLWPGQRITAGRDPRNGVQLVSLRVYPVHFAIEGARDVWVIRDLGCPEGIRVNGRRIGRQVLHGCERIRVGAALLEFLVMAPEENRTDDVELPDRVFLPLCPVCHRGEIHMRACLVRLRSDSDETVRRFRYTCTECVSVLEGRGGGLVYVAVDSRFWESGQRCIGRLYQRTDLLDLIIEFGRRSASGGSDAESPGPGIPGLTPGLDEEMRRYRRMATEILGGEPDARHRGS